MKLTQRKVANASDATKKDSNDIKIFTAINDSDLEYCDNATGDNDDEDEDKKHLTAKECIWLLQKKVEEKIQSQGGNTIREKIKEKFGKDTGIYRRRMTNSAQVILIQYILMMTVFCFIICITIIPVKNLKQMKPHSIMYSRIVLNMTR